VNSTVNEDPHHVIFSVISFTYLHILSLALFLNISTPCCYSMALSHIRSIDEVHTHLAFVDIICSVKPVHKVKVCGHKSAGLLICACLTLIFIKSIKKSLKWKTVHFHRALKWKVRDGC